MKSKYIADSPIAVTAATPQAVNCKSFNISKLTQHTYSVTIAHAI